MKEYLSRGSFNYKLLFKSQAKYLGLPVAVRVVIYDNVPVSVGDFLPSEWPVFTVGGLVLELTAQA